MDTEYLGFTLYKVNYEILCLQLLYRIECIYIYVEYNYLTLLLYTHTCILYTCCTL